MEIAVNRKLKNDKLPFQITSKDNLLIEDWVYSNQAEINDLLSNYGAVLFRGFGCHAGIESVFNQFCSSPLEYSYRSTPRTKIKNFVYTATEYPQHLRIPQHCELAYQRDWPMKLLFQCVKPSDIGGETPLADMIDVTDGIDPEVKAIFREKKVRYVRNYRPGVDLPWQSVFNTDSKKAVEKFCIEQGIDYSWKGDSLKTTQICQAFATHPGVGQEIWFNQAHLFHISALDTKTREALLSFTSEEELPRNSYFGDGTPIQDEFMEHIRSVFGEKSKLFSWRKGDFLLVDNMLVSHGRMPFSGERLVLVTMGEKFSTVAAQ